MKFPASTYRVQLSPDYTLKQLQENLDYLEQLGISTIYAAPVFQATTGSTHGYDVVDPLQINKEIGSLERLKRINRELTAKNMDWLQDIVPNHMAFDGKNPFLRAIFELGPNSRYYDFFDIDWKYKGWGKVMAPFLGGTLPEVLEKNELKLNYRESGFFINYFDNSYACSARSYSRILTQSGSEDWIEKFKVFSGNEEEWEKIKTLFYRKLQENDELKNKVDSAVEAINNNRDSLQEILDLQYFLPMHWKQTEKEINYRRFFTINGLICLRMEDQEVFDTYHAFIEQLCKEGLVSGLRIDHIDGLFDPPGYLEKLRVLVGNDFYVVVEKILEWEEKLPGKWPVQGTSGYAFLAQVNHLFTQTENEKVFSDFYEKINPDMPEYEELVYQKKLFILKERMGGELHNLWLLLLAFLPSHEKRNDGNWLKAFSAFLAAFPVYRIYPEEFPLKNLQIDLIDVAYQKALDHFPEQNKELDHLRSLFIGEKGGNEHKSFYFLQRCQQFTGPLAAKGVEDTSFYIFNRLISHNEVGDSPENFGVTVEGFHNRMLQRMENFPLSINATATHDTKRGEDARMRLNVLSEIPQEWFGKVKEWRNISKKVRKNKNIPDSNEEYFIYQTLIGGMAVPEVNKASFVSRTQEYMQKVLREAKVHSNWAEPKKNYENTVFEFISDILEDIEFRRSFEPFLKKIAHYGVIKSLGQLLVKTTAPGIPDIYQGSELWDLSYVDPDNRRPIDYDLRKGILADLKNINGHNFKEELNSLKQNYGDGKIKMYCMYKALELRKNLPELFWNGQYLPLNITGENSEKFIAYARKNKENWAVVILPVSVTDLFSSEALEPEDIIDNVEVNLPKHIPEYLENVFTGEVFKTEGGTIAIKNLFTHFPVALLKNEL